MLASAPQKAVAGVMVFNELELGNACVRVRLVVSEWYVWSDWRIDARFVENLSWVMSHLPDFTDSSCP